MKPVHIRVCCIAFAGAFCACPALAQTDPVFSYQGQLKEAGVPVTDLVYLEFTLWDALENGNQIGEPFWTSDGVDVVNGLFTVEVDAMAFGPMAFTGAPRWLQIVVTDWNYFDRVELSPRQPITPAPYALYAYDTPGGGTNGSVWSVSGTDIYYNDGYVGIGEEYPWAPLTVIGAEDMEAVVVENWATGTTAILGGMTAAVEGNAGLGGDANSGVTGGTFSPDGAGVYGANYSFGPGICAGVWGYTPNPNGYAGYFDGRAYFTDEVGIGRIPTTKLDVAGTVRMDGFQLTDTPLRGYVLTADDSGEGTWQPPGGGGDSLWTADDQGINYQSGHVGIGASSTGVASLFVYGTGTQAISGRNAATSGVTHGVQGRADSTSGRGVYGWASSAFGQATGVLGETSSPDGYGVWGYNDDDGTSGDAIGVYGFSNSPSGTGVKGHTYAPDGYGVYGLNEGDTGNAIGVYGATSAAGGFGGYFVGRGYFSDSVGIGTAATTSPLTVAGTIESITGGFMFPDGSVQTTAATGGGDSLWQTYGTEIYYDADNVGVGVDDPQSTLHVAGGNWDVSTTEGDFKIGGSVYRLKMGVATSGLGAGHCRIFAGGPSSKLTLGANGTDMLTVTGTDVDVAGKAKMTGFQLTSSPVSGYVLTSDISGNGTWQLGGGGGSFDLPLDRSVAYNGNAFKITNSGTTYATTAIAGIIDSSDSADASAAYFSAQGSGMAIKAASDFDTTIYASNSGSGKAIEGRTSGTGGGYFASTMNGGYGVKGVSSSTGTSSENRGGWFTASGTLGIGVDVEGQRYGVRSTTPTSSGCAVRAEATGSDSTGLHALSPNDGLLAEGGRYAGRFFGKVAVHPYGGGDELFAVNNDGTTQVDVLQIMGGADLSERFDINADDVKAEPGMVVCIDARNPGELVVSEKAYDRTVAGIISGAGGIKTGMMMGQKETVADGAYPVALTGRVYVWADAASGPIQPGDMLTTSNVPGHAMKVTDYGKAHGATLGKAMTSLTYGRGLVLVLVSLQ